MESNSENENKGKINNRYSLRSFPRRERKYSYIQFMEIGLPNYNAELKPFSESTSEIECYSRIQIVLVCYFSLLCRNH